MIGNVDLRPFLPSRRRRSLEGFVESVVVDERGRPMQLAPHHHAQIEFVRETHAMGMHALVLAPFSSGKSTALGLPWALFSLGQNPEGRVKVVSSTAGLAAQKLHSARRTLCSPAYRVAFPAVHIGDKHTETTLYLQRQGSSPDPSLQSCSVGEHVLGGRYDCLILDDVVDKSSDDSPVIRDKVHRWLQETWFGRGSETSLVLAVGTPHHSDDAYARFERTPGWRTLRMPISEDVTHFEQYVVDGSRPGAPERRPDLPLWSSRWPRERLLREQQRNPRGFARGFQLRAYSDGELDFPSFGTKCVEQSALAADWRARRLPTYVGVDISAGGRTGMAIVGLGFDLETGRKHVVEAVYLAGSVPGLMAALDSIVQRQDVRVINVENNATQDLIVELLREQGGAAWRHKVHSHTTTGQNKNAVDLGVKALEVEFSNRGILFPGGEVAGHSMACNCSWCSLKRELECYPKGASTDGTMALWFAVTAARDFQPRRPLPIGPGFNVR